jgi:hypothetical protein
MFTIKAVMIVVKIEGSPYLCKTDEVGELCVCAGYAGIQYWGLQGITVNTFQVCTPVFISLYI